MELWLNEAFATWMSDRVVFTWQPEDFDSRGPLRNASRAMWNDRLPSARAIRQPILSDHDISNAFDRITYSKGGGVLAMFERYLGEELFREGASGPAWVLPSASGGGYFLWSQPARGWDGLLAAFESFSPAEQMSLMTSASGAYRSGTLDLARYLAFAEQAAGSPAWDVAAVPMQVLRDIKNFVLPLDRMEEIQAVYQEIFRPALARFEFSERLFAEGAASSDEALLLGDLLWFLALDARDPNLRARLAPLGKTYMGYGGDGRRHPEILHDDFQRLALIVAAEEEGLSFVEVLIEALTESRDQTFRTNLTAALAYLAEPEVVARVQELILDPDRPSREASRLLYRQARRALNRHSVLAFYRDHEEQILARIPRSHRGSLPWLAGGFCSQEDATAVAAFFEPRIKAWRGGPRQLKQALDVVKICATLANAQRADALVFLAGRAGERD